MRTAYIVLLCILGAAMLSIAESNNGIGPDSCCFQYYPRRLNKNVFVSYSLTDVRCSKPAIILVTKKSRNICADPNLSWVQGIMKNIDENSF